MDLISSLLEYGVRVCVYKGKPKHGLAPSQTEKYLSLMLLGRFGKFLEYQIIEEMLAHLTKPSYLSATISCHEKGFLCMTTKEMTYDLLGSWCRSSKI